MAKFVMRRETQGGSDVLQVEGDKLEIEGHVAVVTKNGSVIAAFAPGRWDSIVEKVEDQGFAADLDKPQSDKLA
jgi:hypothetical protein